MSRIEQPSNLFAQQAAKLQQVTAAAGMACYAHLVAQLYNAQTLKPCVEGDEPTADDLRQAAMRSQRAAGYYAESLGLCKVADAPRPADS